MKPYPVGDDLLRPLLRVAMPRAGRLYAPGGTVHVVARCNNREFYFTTPADFEVLLAHLREMRRTYDVPLYAYTLKGDVGSKATFQEGAPRAKIARIPPMPGQACL